MASCRSVSERSGLRECMMRHAVCTMVWSTSCTVNWCYRGSMYSRRRHCAMCQTLSARPTWTPRSSAALAPASRNFRSFCLRCASYQKQPSRFAAIHRLREVWVLLCLTSAETSALVARAESKETEEGSPDAVTPARSCACRTCTQFIRASMERKL